MKRLFKSDTPVAPELAKPITAYPSSEEVTFARQAGFYQDIYEPWTEGQIAQVFKTSPWGKKTDALHKPGVNKIIQSHPELAEVYAKGALVANRIPIAALGFDPNRLTVIDDLSDPAKVNIAGEFQRSTDTMWMVASSASSIIHESIHRGLQKLRTDSAEAKELLRTIGVNEEYITRYLMAKYAGDPEKGSGEVSDKQREIALVLFEKTSRTAGVRQKLDRLNEIAQELYAKKSPGRGARR